MDSDTKKKSVTPSWRWPSVKTPRCRIGSSKMFIIGKGSMLNGSTRDLVRHLNSQWSPPLFHTPYTNFLHTILSGRPNKLWCPYKVKGHREYYMKPTIRCEGVPLGRWLSSDDISNNTIPSFFSTLRDYILHSKLNLYKPLQRFNVSRSDSYWMKDTHWNCPDERVPQIIDVLLRVKFINR